MAYPIKSGKEAWTTKQVPSLLGGIDSTKAPDQLDDNQTITLHNVTAKSGRIISDTGYTPSGQAVIGFPQKTYLFQRKDLTEDLVLVTTKTVYEWDATLQRWLLIKSTAETTTTSAYAAGTTAIAVAATAGFSDGDVVSVALDNGDQLQGTITIAGLMMTFSAAVPTGRTIANGAAVKRAALLNGDLDAPISAVTVPNHDWMVFTNRVDIVKRFDGTTVEDVPNLPSGGNTICQAVAYYNTALLLIATIEGGVRYNQRVRRSDQTDATNWTTGTAGYDDLLDLPGLLLHGELLGPYLIIYREDGIVRGSFIGSGGINYQWDTTITNEGAISAAAIANIGDQHIFVGHDNIYRYSGDFALTPIGEPIFDFTLGFRGNIDPAYEPRLFTMFIPELDEVWVSYVSADSIDKHCDKVIRYNLTQDFWYTRQFADEMIGWGVYHRRDTLTWATATGTWAAMTGKWNNRAFLAQSPIVQLCAHNAQMVMNYDYQQLLDNSAAISYIVESKDFALGDAEFRLDSIEMKMQGTGVTLEYSVDEGVTYEQLAIITQPRLAKCVVFKQLVTNKIRFRWSGTNSDFIIEWFNFTYKIESDAGYGNNIV